MSVYKHVISHLEGSAPYESSFLGEFEAVTHIARVAVVSPEGQEVWSRDIKDRIISLAIPLPFFDRRLARIATRARVLTDNLNDSLPQIIGQ